MKSVETNEAYAIGVYIGSKPEGEIIWLIYAVCDFVKCKCIHYNDWM